MGERIKKKTFFEKSTLMKPSPILPNRLKTCPQGDFDMLKWNLTSKTFDSATQTSKLRKTTSKKLFLNPFAGLKQLKPMKTPLLQGVPTLTESCPITLRSNFKKSNFKI